MGLFEQARKGDRFGVRDARGRLVLDAEAARQLNAIRAELGRLDRFAASPPLKYSSDATGRRWELALPISVYAKLTGTSGSAYTWGEATRSSSGVSSLVSGGRTDVAYEANGVTGLTGSYATLDWMPAAGDWRFQAIRYSPTPPTCSVRLSFNQLCLGDSSHWSRMTAKLYDQTTGLQVGATADSNTSSTSIYPNLVDGRSYKFTVTFANSCNGTFVSPVDYPFTVDCSVPTVTIPVTPTVATFVDQIQISLMKGGSPTNGTLKYTDDGPPSSTVDGHSGAITNIFFPFLTATGPGTSVTHTLHLEIYYDYTFGGPPVPHSSESRQDLTVTLNYCDSCTDSSGRVYVVNVP